jgi:ABC-type bacteriocin/lantibiotic exporter with double-glycine peptidase domain
MVLRYYGIVTSERDLMHILHTNDDVGTRHEPIIETIRANGLYVYVNNGSTMEEVAYFIRLEYPVIVHFIEPSLDEGHYAVVLGFRGDEIVFNDPWNGERFKMRIKDFSERWKSEDGVFKNWLLVASDAPIPLGKQYTPAK